MAPIHSLTPDRNLIQRVLRTLDFELKNSVQYENSNADLGRILMFDFIESVHRMFAHMNDKNDSQKALIDSLQAQLDKTISKSIVEQSTQTDEISLDLLKEEIIVKIEEGEMNENMLNPLDMENMNEVTAVPHPIPDSLDGLSTIAHFTHPPQNEPKEEVVKPKEEPIDNTQMIRGDNQIADPDVMEEGILNDDVVIGNERDHAISDDLNEKDGEKKKIVDDTANTSKNSSEIVEKRRRSSRNGARPKYGESLEDSDGDSESVMMKSNVDSEKKTDRMVSSGKGKNEVSDSKERGAYKLNDSDLECIECEYRNRNIDAWISHLRRKHSTNPLLAGIALLFECGHESGSSRHIRTCTVAKITVIRKREEPIRRLDDEMVACSQLQ
ncbi:hypothetical protein PENTCL1PPCAC_10487 [Pristionchus entomophagus]|uniref:BED-type domain-containing protein n=1 Tax=Pristionchus entomophagus TaxID=358040 RepID=A0AAV5T016_9BILA|nr:hypothetical protein PENTCL1PPCAC_10487 [Pristionchus entomophagus]